jgi:hypothetical protein
MQVLRALPKGRNDNLDHSQAVEEVASKAALGDFLGENSVGRGDHANVDAPLTVFADAPDLAVLKDAQQLDLHRQRTR